jgi:hypothetical protein
MAIDGDNARQTYLKAKVDRIELCTRTGYRAFAAWFTSGTQPGLHARGTKGTRSTQFRGKDANWIYFGEKVDWVQVPELVIAARAIAEKRGGGRSTVDRELYQPLEKAAAMLSERPAGLHAGGPRAKVLSGEAGVCAALAEAAADHMKKLGDDVAEEYCQRCAKGARNAGAMSCKDPAKHALVRAVTAFGDDAEAARAFVIAMDELVMRHEFEAAYRKHAPGDDEPPAYQRMLWRGPDAKNFPGYWLVRLSTDEYGLLAKLGGRWGWHVSDRDNTFATVPDDLLDAATKMAIARDR